jgi:uncharacterized surface anchored protein
VKFAKFLAVPVVLLVSALMAVPAFAHSATISNLTATCNSDHKVCFSFDVTTSQFDQTGRDVLVDLVDRKSNQVLETLTEHLSANTTHVQDCFHATVSTSTQLTIRIRVPSGSDLDLKDSQTTVYTNGCTSQATPTPSPTPTPRATPTPTATATPTSGGNGGGSPTPTASANTTVALAQTGGFDFRYPLIGLVLLVAGGALFVVSASRGRSAQTK